MEENGRKWRKFLPPEQPREPKCLDVTLNIAGVENTLEKLAVVMNTGGHSIGVLNEMSISDGGNLCPLWLMILELV